MKNLKMIINAEYINNQKCVYEFKTTLREALQDVNKEVVVALMLFSVFVFGSVNGFAQQIFTGAQFESIGIDPNFPLNGSYELMNDITVNQMVAGVFTGNFNGGGNRITVAITSNAPNVGLFSQYSGGRIDSLIIDGFVVGGALSQNVGGLAGLVLSGQISFVTNLADVTCTNHNASVGGIAGALEANDWNTWIAFSHLENNGIVTGGRYVAGIVGRNSSPAAYAIIIRTSQNAGTIRIDNAFLNELPTYIAGIVAYIPVPDYSVRLHDLVNIGKILSSAANFAGGVVAYLENGWVHTSCNSGIVEGATTAVGGIAGYLGSNGEIVDCINTNWVDNSNNIPSAGAIVGNNNGTITNCYYDNQMCILEGIGTGVGGQAESRPTVDMLGFILQTQFLSPGQWVYRNNLYPRPRRGGIDFNHPITLLSAAPIYLQNNPATGMPERLDNVTQNFFVANFNNNNPLSPFLIPAPYFYQWGWYPGGGFISSSMMGDVSAIIPPWGIATVSPFPSGNWDSLSVRFDFPNYGNNGFTPGVVFEKIVPIFVTP